mgnify:CR=1 FL=1
MECHGQDERQADEEHEGQGYGVRHIVANVAPNRGIVGSERSREVQHHEVAELL